MKVYKLIFYFKLKEIIILIILMWFWYYVLLEVSVIKKSYVYISWNKDYWILG